MVYMVHDGENAYYQDWSDAPKTPGYYWAKDRNGRKQIVEVYEIAGELRVWKAGYEQDYDLSIFVSWLGAIPEPETYYEEYNEHIVRGE